MRKALVVWGGWDGHQPKQCVDVFIPWLKEQGFEVTVTDNMDAYCDAALMQALSVIVPCWTMGTISGEQEKGLLEAVRGGVGIAGWHGGMGDAFRVNCGYQFMTGGQFVGHPGGIIPYTVNIIKPNDPLVKGIADFTITSEQYYMHTDPGNNVLATTTFSGAHEGMDWIKGVVMPVVWTRPYGKGRVFYSSLGHIATDFDIPAVRTIMQRGILWAARA
ncbi:MAG: ThuA domain-containing protein [bacterium]|nr:ThuA domain-containing protein [bacterium]